jgi:hypothetical protein
MLKTVLNVCFFIVQFFVVLIMGVLFAFGVRQKLNKNNSDLAKSKTTTIAFFHPYWCVNSRII